MRTTDLAGKGLRLTPFRGVRYVPEQVTSLSAVTSPPYDVVVRPDGLHHLECADPHNIVRLILPQAATPAARHRQAADTLARWLADGVLAVDPEPALYVYEQRGESAVQRGVIGSLALPDPADGVVLPHEDVMAEIVEDRADLMRATASNLEPLLLTYEGDGTTQAVLDRVARRTPLLATTTEDGYAHKLWSVTSAAEQAEITTGLARHQALIADGHHRWATYQRLREEHPGAGPWSYGLVLLVDTLRHPLQVRAIHRLLHGVPVAEAAASLHGFCRVRTLDAALPEALDALAAATAEGNAFLLAGDGGFRLVDRPDAGLLERTVRHDRPAAWRQLDATVLHSALIDEVWRVPDGPDHIGYIHDTVAAVRKAEQDGSTAVLLHPVREDVVRDLARKGVTMPRKSTSFGPKPATGLVLRTLAAG